MRENRTQQGFWASVGKLSALLTVLGAIVWAVGIVVPVGPRLTATATLADYYALPSVNVGVNQARAVLESARAARSVNATDAGALEQALEVAGPRFKQGPSTYASIRLVNRGNRVAEGVVVWVPGAVEAAADGGDSEEQPVVSNDRVELGSMRPGTTLNLRVWSDRLPFAVEDGLRIAHNGGDGKIRVARSVTGVPAALADFGDTFGWFGPFFVFAAFAAAMLLYSTLRPRETEVRHRRPEGDDSAGGA